ncbi:MAG: nitroreductase family protein [Flavobacteriales bacterium]|nr:nitroreductase family protein [Flavobacteriales bacterium]
MHQAPTIPLEFTLRTEAEMLVRAQAFHATMCKRRSVRHFSDRPVPFAVLQEIIRTASTAPSGANKQPWTFCPVDDPGLKHRIRLAAEEEEYRNYHGRMSDEWLQDLEPFGTDHRKPFLETAPWLVVVFKQVHGLGPDGAKRNHYYVTESVGLASGLLLAAAHHAGLATLTHTPSPMNFLNALLGRPSNERPFLLIPMGFPVEGCRVPDLARKPLDQVLVRYGPGREG